MNIEKLREALKQHRDGVAGVHQYDELAKAARKLLSPADVLRWQGWETCSTCEGEGEDLSLDGYPTGSPCSDCANGLTPSQSMVEAAAVAIHLVTAAASDGPSYWMNEARAALVAAARKEKP